jgi:hypothetical protein
MFARKLTRLFLGAVAFGMTMTIAVAATGQSGKVVPPSAKVMGWTLDDMAFAVADFSISGNDPAFYPDTPFQILYRHPGGNQFNLAAGTYCYVNVVFFDDSAPIIGDWPADKDGAAEYMFGRDQLGGHDLFINVDGHVTSLDDAGYIGLAPTPTSPDGSNNIIKVAAFLTPLSAGDHEVTIGGVFDGDAIIDAFGGPFAGQVTYHVHVE